MKRNPRYDRTPASECEWAWAAGLFEGEGSIVLSGRRVRLQLKMTDQDVVQRFCDVVGGRVLGPYSYALKDGFTRKAAWVWNSDGTDAAYTLRRFEPWLGSRRLARIDQLHLFTQSVFIFD